MLKVKNQNKQMNQKNKNKTKNPPKNPPQQLEKFSLMDFCPVSIYEQCSLMFVRRAWQVNRKLNFYILFKLNLPHHFNEKQN